MSENNKITRREFLSYSAMAGVAGALGVSPLLSSCSKSNKTAYTPLKQPGEYYIPELPDKAADGRELKAGVIGCGGRGSGATEDLLNAANGITIVALGDVFEDRLMDLKNKLKSRENNPNEVADDKCFVGFDAYQKVIDSGVDIVIVATPPAFRPEHFRYAVEKGVNCFLEKPICVDAEGYRVIMAAAKQAKAKGLTVITGTQRHHQRGYVEAFKRIQEGMIGEITGGNVYWNGGKLWYRQREQGWSDMEWMIRDWVNWTWLSGDHIVEQHVHNIDVFNWFTGYKPVSATSFGSRQRRVTGNQFDNFSTDFVYDNGVHLHSMCRQIDGCSNNISEEFFGTMGSFESGQNGGGECLLKDLKGNVIWKYENDPAFQQQNPYVLEHVNFVNCIRNNTPLVLAEDTAMSSLMAVMGRQSAYTGQTLTWDETTKADMNLMPAKLELGPMDIAGSTVPVPGLPG